MKVNFLASALMLTLLMICPFAAHAQLGTNHVVNVQKLKQVWPENGSRASRDSLIGIYNAMVIQKNEFILSHREYSHFYTGDNKDYLVIQEYLDLASMEKAAAKTMELEKLAWPDEAKAKAFFDAMDAYFENWHGDALYSTNNKLSKN